MYKKGPIVIIEDDTDDRNMYVEIFRQLDVKNPVIAFENGVHALEYLAATPEHPFLILCDVNLSQPNGFQLRALINEQEKIRRKSIPFLFVSTTDEQKIVNQAYELTVQGFFVKKYDVNAMLEEMRLIYNYWQRCQHPYNQ